MSDNVIYLVPPGKIRCYLTGNLRDDTPEEHVRQRWVRSLIEEYGYPKTDIAIEAAIVMGRSRKRADVVIYRHDAPRTQENITVIVEAKRDETLISDRASGEDQLKSYMAACSSCRFGLWVGRERAAFEKTDHGIDRIHDIPRFGADTFTPPTHDDLVVAHELKSVFRRCHNYIYTNAGLQKAEAFHEFLKLIFCKTYDEEEHSEQLRFYVGPRERGATSGQRRLLEDRLTPLFRSVVERYPFIFNEGESIRLEPRVASYVVSELQFLSLLNTVTDVKGDAYEELVGANLRGDRGEFFTPRNVCDMAVRMAMSLYNDDRLTSLRVLDCCCGTGGFLVSWLNNLYKRLLRQELSKGGMGIPEERARRRVREFCDRNLFGLDINPFLVRTCQMNLVLHGDGSSNVHRVNSVQSPGEWDDEARRSIPFGKVDIVLTNPPFGGEAKIEDAHVLGQYELPSWERKSQRSSIPAERLFIETAMRFLKPGGHLVIVLPDGILNNPGAKFIRSWLLNRAKLIAVIDLPDTTFAASKGVNNPSVIVVQRYSEEQARRANNGILDNAYEFFMSIPRTAGINKRAKPIYVRHPDGREYTGEDGQRVKDDQIGTVVSQFRDWLGI